ncbi:glycoside hydrolase (plasmid) [Hymenobacter tibetensis]|uniref:exo-alpha-sialidase n=1 Tax=Hymenobacter tibetensis TaxID=497967 RepID=A0ABY4D4J6_9BACT|nr:sialidase family protein [Hymenobacter tibetensis]UOG77451.1 glycoside hydrolase [Hymenobacter tibetensis]
MTFYAFRSLYPFLLGAGLLACRTTVPRATQPVTTSPAPPAAPEETVVFQNGEGGYLCYRIPAIVKAPTGELLAFAEGRVTDCGDFGDVDLVLRASSDNGKTWGPVRRAADYNAAQVGNPAPVYDLTDPRFPNGRLFLLYNTGTVSEGEVRAGKAIREVWYITSTDHGNTWSAPVNITTQVNRPNKPAVNPQYGFAEDWRSYANTPGHALQLSLGAHKGRLFVAANHSAGPPQPQARDYRAHGFYSDDHGRTWHLSPTIPYPGGNESTAAETSSGGVLMNIRNQSGDAKNRLLTSSPDVAQFWEPVRVAQDLPDPVCQGSMVNYQAATGQRYLLFSNANSQAKREKLTVRVSQDDGQSWPISKEIYAGSAAYSDLVIQQNQQIGVLYEKDNYNKIVYTQFSYNWLAH